MTYATAVSNEPDPPLVSHSSPTSSEHMTHLYDSI
jgi:hypothetical protein